MADEDPIEKEHRLAEEHERRADLLKDQEREREENDREIAEAHEG